jgi:hypothetical protein
VTGVLCAVVGASAGGLIVAAFPTGASASSAVSQTMTTSTTTASVVAGGTGPYTYAWTVADVDGMAGCSATAPSAATTSFFCDTVEGDNGSATATCLITDTADGRTGSVLVTISASFTGTPP